MAEILLEKQQEPARLRIYIGAAPGVGKTYHMLNDAHILRQQGVDLVIGLVETHGRKDTQDQIRDLEIVPQRVIPYRGVNLKEMDVDAIMARHPKTVVVDELAHTNVPGSKNRKRYEDVLELLEAGIDVMTAVNIQHLETLNDAVSRSANTTIRETIPDNFLKRADEVVNIDITVDELRSRLRQGKIYAPEKVEQSLANFFRKGNLNMLRELALRTTAEPGAGTGADSREGDGVPEHAAGHRAAAAGGRARGGAAGEQLVRRLRDSAGRQRAWRRRSFSPAGGIPEDGARPGSAGSVVDRSERVGRADSVCAAGEYFARGLRAIGALAVRYSVSRVGAEPVSVRGEGCDGAGGADAEAGSTRVESCLQGTQCDIVAASKNRLHAGGLRSRLFQSEIQSRLPLPPSHP